MNTKLSRLSLLGKVLNIDIFLLNKFELSRLKQTKIWFGVGGIFILECLINEFWLLFIFCTPENFQINVSNMFLSTKYSLKLVFAYIKDIYVSILFIWGWIIEHALMFLYIYYTIYFRKLLYKTLENEIRIY